MSLIEVVEELRIGKLLCVVDDFLTARLFIQTYLIRNISFFLFCSFRCTDRLDFRRNGLLLIFAFIASSATATCQEPQEET